MTECGAESRIVTAKTRDGQAPSFLLLSRMGHAIEIFLDAVVNMLPVSERIE